MMMNSSSSVFHKNNRTGSSVSSLLGTLLSVVLVSAGCLLLVATTSFGRIAEAASLSDIEQQCNGHDPMESVKTYLGMSLDYEMSDTICCHNHRYAEPRGYQEDVDFFTRLEEHMEETNSTETVFYDSVCGLPLFVAPRGRSFGDFKDESLHHGWPSFRPEELVSENVIVHVDGRMESVCLTHLGHNLPSGGADRYCIDLVCVAGQPLTYEDNTGSSSLYEDFPSLKRMSSSSSGSEEAKLTDDSTATTTTSSNVIDEASASIILTAEDFDPDSYESSAEQNSGKVSNTKRNGIIVGVVAVAALIGIYVYCACNKNRYKESYYNDNNSKPATETTQLQGGPNVKQLELDGGSANDTASSGKDDTDEEI